VTPVGWALTVLLTGVVAALAVVPWLRAEREPGDVPVMTEDSVEEELHRRFCPWCGHRYDRPGDLVCPACGQDRAGGTT
jgi:hypothetical protein